MSGDGDSESGSGDNDEWCDWDEDLHQMAAKCLFHCCELESAEQVFQHCVTVHDFDLLAIIKSLELDNIDFIKVVNFIRSIAPDKLPSSESLKQLILNPENWSNDRYMIPSISNDPVLMYDVEGEYEPMNEDTSIGTNDLSSASKPNILEHKVSVLKQNLKQKDELIHCLYKDIESLKKKSSSLIKAAEKVSTSECTTKDSNYFQSYSHFGIHYEMLQDTVRTESYQKAMLKNRNSFYDKLVLDIGCGSAILSMFAAQAGAKKVIGVDQSDVIYYAMDIIRENQLENRIELIKGRVEELESEQKFDIIVSEWMGYFLLFEGMLDSVIVSRDKYLKPGGLILPNKCLMKLGMYSDVERYHSYVDFWYDVYGFKMTCIKKEVVREVLTEVVPGSAVVSNYCTIKEYDLYTCSKDDLEFSSTFSLRITRSCSVTGFVGFFDSSFDLENQVQFSTSPHDVPTHWKQACLFLPEPMVVREGDLIEGKIILMKVHKDPRSYRIQIMFNDFDFTYNLS